MDSINQSILASDLRVVFDSFCFSINFELENHIVRVFGMMNLIRNPLIIDFGKRLFVAMSYSMVQFGSISIHDRTGSLNVYNKQSAFHCF